MHLFSDPEDGGTAYYCTKCLFSGNSIEFLQRINSFNKLPEVIQELRVNSNKYQLPASVFTPSLVDSCLKAITFRRKLNKFWDRCKENFVSGSHPTWRAIATRLHLWYVGSKQTRIEMSQYVGAATKELLEEFEIKPFSKGFKAFLIVPFYSAPGRISSFYCIPESTSINPQWISFFKDENTSDYGLMGLVGEAIDESTLFVVSDPVYALQLLRDKLVRSNKPIPVSVYTPTCNLAYKTVGMSTIFWSHRQDLDFWRNVYTAKGRVAEEPRMRIKPGTVVDHDSWNSLSRTKGHTSGPGTRLKQMLESSRPWTEALKDYLLNLDFSEALNLSNALSLTTSDVNLLKAACASETEKSRLDSLLSQDGGIGLHIFNNKEYVLKPDGIYRTYKGNNEERVASVRVIPDKILTNPKDPVNRFVTGTIKTLENDIPFICRYEDLAKNPVGTLATTMVKEGLGHPYIAPHFERQFFAFCQSLTPNLQQVIGSAKAGWVDSEFILPNFSITKGEFVHKNNTILDDAVPFAEVYAPKEPLKDDLLRVWQQATETPISLALAAAILNNMLAPITGGPRCGIGVVGKAADKVVAAVSKELGLVSFSFEQPRITTHFTAHVKKLQGIESQHDIPTYVVSPVTPQKAFKSWLNSDNKNSLVTLTPTQARFVGVTGKWLFVKVESANLLAIRGFQQIIPLFLRWFQRNDGVLPKGRSIAHSILLSLWEMLNFYNSVQSDMLTAAEAVLNDESVASNVPLGTKILHAIFSLIENGAMPPAKVDYYGSSDVLSYDRTKNRLRIQKKAFVDAVKLNNLPMELTDIGEIAASFSSLGVLLHDTVSGEPSWVISYAYWEDCYSKWSTGE